MSVLDSLAVTESGGNFAARNNAVGSSGREGHFGRLQFGRDRLDDAIRAGVVPVGTTPQQFMANPELQARTEQWHKQDLMNQAESLGLTRYIGQEVGGVPITMDGIVAMGHLGGMGGARRFLESGGRDNPQDAYGTSLRDYAAKHGGISREAQTTPQQQPEVPRNALSRPYIQPPTINALNAVDFQVQSQRRPMYGYGAGNNPFVR